MWPPSPCHDSRWFKLLPRQCFLTACHRWIPISRCSHNGAWRRQWAEQEHMKMGHMVCWKLLDSFDGFGLLNSKLVNEQNAKITSMHTHTHTHTHTSYLDLGLSILESSAVFHFNYQCLRGAAMGDATPTPYGSLKELRPGPLPPHISTVIQPCLTHRCYYKVYSVWSLSTSPATNLQKSNLMMLH